MSTFPDGVFEYGGAPVSGGRFSSPWATHYFVDGTDGSDTHTGKAPDRAKATIQAAVTAAVGGDVIYIRPKVYTIGTGFARYTEDVSVTLGGAGGSAVTATNANISIIGVTSNRGNAEYGGVRWKFTTATNLTVDAPALHVENIGFFSESATYGILLRNNGATLTQQGSNGFSMYNCVLKGKGLYVLSGGDGICIERTRFHCGYDGAVAALSMSCSANPGRRLIVRNCDWQDGNATTSSGPCIVIAAPCSEVLIDGCTFGQLPTGGAYISAAGANYGILSNCTFGVADMTKATGLVLGSIIAAACYDGKVALID